MIKWSIIFDNLPFLVAGAWTTLALTVVSMIFATVAGLLVGLMNMFGGKVIGAITRVYIEAIRGTPALLLILIVYYAPVSYTHLRAHETRHDLVCRLLLEKKKKNKTYSTSVSYINIRTNENNSKNVIR